MMKATAALFLSAALAVFVCGAGVSAQAPPDLTGTWVGSTLVPDVGEDGITLELKREGESYTGRCVDAAGVIVAPEIKNVAVKDGTLTFDIGVMGGAGPLTVHILLKIDGDTMVGRWATDDGESAELKLTKQIR